MHNDQSELLHSSNPLITSIVVNSFLLGMPLTDDKEVLDEYADFHAELAVANQEIEEEFENEQDDKRSITSFVVDFITNRFFPSLNGFIKSFLVNQLQLPLMWEKLKDKFQIFSLTVSIAMRMIIGIVAGIAKAVLKGLVHVAKLLLKHPYGWAVLALSGIGLAIYSFFVRKKIPEHLKKRNSLLDFDINHTMALMYPEYFGDGIPLDVTEEEKTALVQLRASDTDIFTPETEILHTMKTEGWDKIFSDGREYSKFGIASNARRSKEFVRSLNWKQAYDIYKREYWDAAQVESVPEELQRVYFNTAVNMGVQAAKELYRQSDGTLQGFVNARNARYRRIAANDPFKRRYLQGWLNRSRQEYLDSINAIKNVDQFRKAQSKENAELIRVNKVLGAV